MMKFFMLLCTTFLFCVACQTDNNSTTNNNTTAPAEPRPKVSIKTALGTMVVELYNETPKHRDNFIKLAKEGFYDSLLFHRVQQNFMIHGGDPDSRGEVHPAATLGKGGPDYTIPAEILPQFIHKMGALCAYNGGKKRSPNLESNGSQFFIVDGQPLKQYQLDQLQKESGIKYTPEQTAAYLEMGGVPMLDQTYTVFGEVVEGFDILHKIAASKTMRMNDPVMPDRPVEDIRMTITVLEK